MEIHKLSKEALLIPTTTWDWNAHLRFCEGKHIPLHVDCSGFSGLFQRANYKILLWLWTLLFSLLTCPSLGIKSRFLAAVCQQQKYDLMCSHSHWACLVCAGGKGRFQEDKRRDQQISSPVFKQDFSSLASKITNSCWEDPSRWRAALHCPLPQVHRQNSWFCLFCAGVVS